jgi:UDP-3-O-acyl N-acetylglucosamine deacetylase
MGGSGAEGRPVRRTLRRAATIHGATLFTAANTTLTINPASAGMRGIFFQRTDLPGLPVIPARHDSLFPEPRRTVLRAKDSGASVETVEHVLSALAGLGITDALLRIDGPEVPVGDGSANAFVSAILAAGIEDVPQQTGMNGCRGPVVIREPARFADGVGTIEALPAEKPGLELVYRLDYGADSPIPAQSARLFVPPGGANGEYALQIAPARTFCLLAEAQAMRKMGMFAHLEPRDLLVIGEQGPIDNEYRFDNEPARHKVLDLLGDLSLAGRPIWGRVVATRTGHTMNHAVAARLAEMP